MRQILSMASIAALAACSQPAEESPTPADTTASATATTRPAEGAESMAVDGKPDAGTYEVTGPDGSVAKLSIAADGTFSREAGGQVTKGTWTKKGAATYCITMEGATEVTCYTDTMDGTTWRMTNDADPADTSTVVRTS